MSAADRTDDLGDQLYEQYGRPLEAEHWGEYVVIYPDGRTVLGSTAAEAMVRADERVGRGGYLFKVGDRVLGRIR